MIRKYLLTVVALIGFLFAVWMVIQGNKEVPAAKPLTQPAQSQFEAPWPAQLCTMTAK